MRKKKKYELVEALATLCRDVGYKKVTAESFDEEEFVKKVVDLLDCTIDFDAVDEIHQRFYEVLAANKKIKSLLSNDEFKEAFNRYLKGKSIYKKVDKKNAVGSLHLNNYFGLDSETIFAHGPSDKLKTIDCKHHIIGDKDDHCYVNSKKAIVYDDKGNKLVQVLCKDADFIFKHNKLPFAVAFNFDNGFFYALSEEYYNSLDDISDADIEKCLAIAVLDTVGEDTSLTYARVINVKGNDTQISLFIYVIIAAMCSVPLALGKTKKSNSILSLLLLGMILKKI